jgi:molecular chaperone DnaJ
MSTREDLYIILEIRSTASVNEIKRAFRKLARRFHPDINPGDRVAEEHFKKISDAYEVLSDPVKREFYDQNGFYSDGVLEPQRTGNAWGFSFQGFDFSRSTQPAFGDVLSHFFSRQAQRRDPERGQDLEYQAPVGFDDSVRGLTTRVTVFRKQVCEPCGGSGQARGSSDPACMSCAGTGQTTRTKGHLKFAVTCPDCGGVGRIVLSCGECGGDGRRQRSETLEAVIPAGVTTGSRIRFPSKGDTGRFGGPAGDLYVVTNVAAHPFFRRAGDNIHCSVRITFPEAALGTKIEVPTIDGHAIVRIPPGTQNNQTFRLRGKGAPSLLHPGVRGDQYVEVYIAVPRIADERSKEILREFAKLNPDDSRRDLSNGPQEKR